MPCIEFLNEKQHGNHFFFSSVVTMSLCQAYVVVFFWVILIWMDQEMEQCANELKFRSYHHYGEISRCHHEWQTFFFVYFEISRKSMWIELIPISIVQLSLVRASVCNWTYHLGYLLTMNKLACQTNWRSMNRRHDANTSAITILICSQFTSH